MPRFRVTTMVPTIMYLDAADTQSAAELARKWRDSINMGNASQVLAFIHSVILEEEHNDRGLATDPGVPGAA